ncbi:MAG: rhodanese-like domain-containing protein, partial [Spirochaetota bacterium]|nr:rhodanese-like domain-containing protein [Spirochaetota bacterium]
VIQLSTDSPPGNIYVYRGERIKLVIPKINYSYSIHIPEYNISKHGIVGKRLEVEFKAKNIGVFPIFCNGKCPTGDGAQFGQITVMQYESKGDEKYIEVNAKQAKKIIEKLNPLIIDVRTPNEFYSSHLKNAKLIPLSQLENRVSEIAEYKNKNIFIYCRSGNRSTVAAEILIKHGFMKIYNLRTGIKEWIKLGYEVVK